MMANDRRTLLKRLLAALDASIERMTRSAAGNVLGECVEDLEAIASRLSMSALIHSDTDDNDIRRLAASVKVKLSALSALLEQARAWHGSSALARGQGNLYGEIKPSQFNLPEPSTILEV